LTPFIFLYNLRASPSVASCDYWHTHIHSLSKDNSKTLPR
jgi:hypothetical protein